jgi:hypothetical protein
MQTAIENSLFRIDASVSHIAQRVDTLEGKI